MRQIDSVLARRFEAVVFDWDGTAVPDRTTDGRQLREVIEALCAAGMYVAVVSGTHLGNIDTQLTARPSARGRLVLALNRGSEVFVIGEGGPQLAYRRDATFAEDAALDEAANLTLGRLAARGLTVALVSQRLNRRKIDLIPLSAWADPPKARIGELLDAVEARLFDAGLNGLPEVVEVATQAARDAGLADPRVTSDAKHVEIGLTDKSDSAQWLFRDLWARGIGPGVVLIGGDEFGSLGGIAGSDSFMLVPEAQGAAVASVGAEPSGVPDGVQLIGGGPPVFVGLLRDQLARRDAWEPPGVDEQEGWSVIIDGIDPERERVHEALLTISDGTFATSGAPSLRHPSATPDVLMAGIYDGDGPETHLLGAPRWQLLDATMPTNAPLRRVLDLHTGILREELPDGDLCAVRFEPLAHTGTAVLRAAGRAVGESAPLVAPDADIEVDAGDTDAGAWMRTTGSQCGIVAAARQRFERAPDGTGRLERFATFHTDANAVPGPEAALERLSIVASLGFEQVLVEHRAAWAARWADCDIIIEGDDVLQQAVRFALFHLNGAAGDTGEAAVGARGLTGPGYRGHVFWDSDVFVLPYLAATHPTAARAMLEYRVRRLPAARAAARAAGYAGARFPWESAHSGRDVTPPAARDRSGRLVPIRTGLLEDHIVADVAWAAACYVDWTGDEEFANGPGRELLVETARYWASRIRIEPDGSAHILGVIGPDEYHEQVDDNAFTNVMARWNLRRAAEIVGATEDTERRKWLKLADALVDGFDPESGVYEQFAGFHHLEPLIIADVAPSRPVAADLLLGRERVQGAQVVKQADVLMLHHLVPGEVAPDSLEPNLRFYEPRTAHGSSLSPGIHAALFARARDEGRALEALRMAARIDLDDLTNTTAAGLHLATLGSVWQAFAFGFAGMRPQPGGILALDPWLPSGWSAFELCVRFRASRVRLRKEHGVTVVYADPAVRIRVGNCDTVAEPDGTRLRKQSTSWEVAP